MSPTRRPLRLLPALVPALVALCILTSCVSPSLETPSITTVEKEAWSDSSRCFHMMQDESPEIQPSDRFASASTEIREFREDMIGTKNHCCDHPDCEGALNVGEWTWLKYELQQLDNDVISILMRAIKSWGGSGTGFYPHPIVVSAETGLKLTLPAALSDVSMVDLAAAMKQEFIDGNACDGGLEKWSQDQEQLRGWYFADLKKGHPFVVKNGEWHWVKVGHPRHCNAGHRLWTIPTGVKFEP